MPPKAAAIQHCSFQSLGGIGQCLETFFFLVRWDLNSGLRPTKQVLYHLSHTSSPFYSGYFGMESHELFAQAGLNSDLPNHVASRVARITA
jgi:hypothetical protein